MGKCSLKACGLNSDAFEGTPISQGHVILLE